MQVSGEGKEKRPCSTSTTGALGVLSPMESDGLLSQLVLATGASGYAFDSMSTSMCKQKSQPEVVPTGSSGVRVTPSKLVPLLGFEPK